jgi:hypothetical protein
LLVACAACRRLCAIAAGVNRARDFGYGEDSEKPKPRTEICRVFG